MDFSHQKIFFYILKQGRRFLVILAPNTTVIKKVYKVFVLETALNRNMTAEKTKGITYKVYRIFSYFSIKRDRRKRDKFINRVQTD